MNQASRFPHLVVIGASAGGLEALSTLVSTLAPDFPAPVVIAQHLDPTRPSYLADILAIKSTLPVKVVPEHEPLPLQPSIISVVPAGRHVHIDDSHIALLADSEGRPTPSIDLLLGSAAQVYGERLVAVILTGMGSDGASGALAVNAAGGTVVIQNPNTARFPSMPRSLAPTSVDVVADVERIGPILSDLLRGDSVPAEPGERKLLEGLLARLRERVGIDLARYKQPTVWRRLQRRIAATDTHDLAGYLLYLDEYPVEYERLANAILIKVTRFFRDPELFDHLRDHILPDLIREARARGRPLRLWSAGCSTGEEAYSLAILVSEALGPEPDLPDVRVLATDADTDAIAFARRGIYPASAFDDVPGELRSRYFTERDGNFEASKRVRGLIVFGEHDLGHRAPFPHIDLVVCRNVLIYFTPELQRHALRLFAYSLREGGFLVLGKAETIAPLSEYFETLGNSHKVYRRNGEQILMPIATSAAPTVPRPVRFALPRAPRNTARLQASSQQPPEEHQIEVVLPDVPVGVVVVDRNYDIRSINAAGRRLLGIHTPAIGEDLLHAARGLPYDELRAAIDSAIRDGTSGLIAELSIRDVMTGDSRYLKITCHRKGRGRAPAGRPGYDRRGRPDQRSPRPPGSGAATGGDGRRVGALATGG